MKDPFKKSLPMGILSAAVGAIVGLLLVATATGSGYAWFLVVAPTAAFITGTALWWLFVARKARYDTLPGVLTGALAGAVGHYVCWYLFFLAAATCHGLTGGCTDTLGQAPLNVIQAVPAAGVYSVFSLLFFGWLTVPAGAIVGGFLARAQRRANSLSARQS